MPFGSDGSKVEQILASLQLTSVPGRIQRTKILNNFQMQADLLLSGKIRSGFSKSNSSIEGANLSQVPDTFTLVLEMESAERACRVVWRRKARIGVRFG